MKENEIISELSINEWQSIRDRYYIKNCGMDIDAAESILIETNEILKNLNIKYFLSCGTALGLYRDGSFISWDDEIDIEVFSEVFEPKLKEIKQKFIDNGFIARATFRGNTSKMAVFKNGIKVAMGAIYDNGKGFRCDLGQKFPIKFYNNPEIFNFKNEKYIMPGPISEYLTFYYGNWKIPIKSYNPNDYLNPNGEWRK